MTYMPLAGLAAFTAVGGLLCGFLGALVLRLTLTRRLKKKLKATDDYWNSGTLDFGFLNTFFFAWACTLPFASRSANFKAMYSDLDVKGFATVFERSVAYLMTVSFALSFISLPIFYLFKA